MSKISKALFQGMLHGLEKENLRVDKKGQFSKISHEQALKTSANDPHYTLDFAECQLEVVSSPHDSFAGLFQELNERYQYVHQHIAPEILWPNSMPPQVRVDEIQIAHFGNSTADQIKERYRQGLIHRYGKMMQVISGIHYNVSLPENFFQYYQSQYLPNLSLQAVRDHVYFRMIQFYLEHYWLLIYLSGASPMAYEDSLKPNTQASRCVQKVHEYTYLAPYATSLRQSDLGYHNPKSCELMVCFKDLECYISTLERALQTPFSAYENIPLGEQLNANYLQIENEFYAPIRPKQTLQPNERPLNALKDRGVAYLEVRILDINPLLPFGVAPAQLALIDLILISGLLQEPAVSLSSCNEYGRYTNNALNVCLQGRDPELYLQTRNNQKVLLRTLADELMITLRATAELLDEPIYHEAITYAHERIKNPELLSSAQIAKQAHRYKDFMLELAHAHQVFFLAQTK